MADRRGAYSILVGRPEGKRPRGRPRLKWEDNIENIKVDLQEVGWGGWTGLIRPRIGQVVGACECGNEASASIKCREFLE
jgi:hypothetical protein